MQSSTPSSTESVPELLQQALANPDVATYVRSDLTLIFKELGVGISDAANFTEWLMVNLAHCTDVHELQQNVIYKLQRITIGSKTLLSIINEEKDRAAETTFNHLSRFLFRDHTILHLGCGDGRSTELIMQRIHPRHIIGFETDCNFAKNMTVPLRQLTEGGKSLGLYDNDTFDVVVMTGLHVFSEDHREEMIGHIRRVLKRAGTLIIIMSDPVVYDSQEMSRMFVADYVQGHLLYATDRDLQIGYETPRDLVHYIIQFGFGLKPLPGMQNPTSLGFDQKTIRHQHSQLVFEFRS